MSVFTEGPHTAEFILSEGNGQISRMNVTIDGSSAYAGVHLAGTVMAKLTNGTYVPATASNTAGDGSETAVAILLADVDTTDGDVVGVIIARDAEVNGNLLTYDTTVDTAGEIATKATQLASVGIIVR